MHSGQLPNAAQDALSFVTNQTHWSTFVLICDASGACLGLFSRRISSGVPTKLHGGPCWPSRTHLHAQGRPLQAEHCGRHRTAGRPAGGGRCQRPRLLRQHHAGGHRAVCGWLKPWIKACRKTENKMWPDRRREAPVRSAKSFVTLSSREYVFPAAE